MPRKRFLALLAAATTVAGCASPPAPKYEPRPPRPAPSAQLGTVTPAYPVGTGLELGIEVLDAIPVTELSTTEPIPLDATDPCTSVPAAVVTPAGFDPTPVNGDGLGCRWRGSGLSLITGTGPTSMAKDVEDHLAMANGRSTDRLAHLAWLHIDNHYATERILEFDRAKSCWLSLDVSAPQTIYVLVFPVDPTTNEPAESDPDTSVQKVCPVTRHVARNLLDHLDGPGFWEPGVRPTG